MYGAPVEHGHHLAHKGSRDKIGVWEYLCTDKLDHLKHKESQIHLSSKETSSSTISRVKVKFYI